MMLVLIELTASYEFHCFPAVPSAPELHVGFRLPCSAFCLPFPFLYTFCLYDHPQPGEFPRRDCMFIFGLIFKYESPNPPPMIEPAAGRCTANTDAGGGFSGPWGRAGAGAARHDPATPRSVGMWPARPTAGPQLQAHPLHLPRHTRVSPYLCSSLGEVGRLSSQKRRTAARAREHRLC